jgi:predicted phage terminase large subunit-like protein
VKPLSARELNQLAVVVALESERRKYRRLRDFLMGVWPIIEPGVPYTHGWHIDAICEHLEACAAREIRNLIINMPPRHAKSIIVAVAFFCWMWSRSPYERFLYSSYSGALSVRDSLKCRRVVTSEWYKRLWGHRVELSYDQAAKTKFENTNLGMRLATSVGGITTGEGGDFVVCDDPISAMDANSDVVRGEANEWWDTAMSTRLNDPKTGCRIVVMQRLHERDLTGHWLASEKNISTRILPARVERHHPMKNSRFVDPRKEDGDLLWPEKYGEPELKILETALGSYGTAGQLQQRPAPEGGGILVVKHFQVWSKDKPLPDFIYVLQSYDGAYTDKTQNDPTAGMAWGVFEMLGKRHVLLLDCWTDWFQYAKLRRRIIDDWAATYGGHKQDNGVNDPLHPPRRADAILVENKSSGISIIQDLRQANIPAIEWNPGHADKVNRAYQAQPLLELGCFWVLESEKRPGEVRSWVKPFFKQCEQFPNGEHDDMVDCFTQAAIYLRDTGWLQLPKAALDDVPLERDYHNDRRVKDNPYLH